MNIEIIIIHIFLAILLFFIINWIGKHSYSIGYMQISMFLKREESPAFNFLFRIISPIVYLFLISAILYKLNLDRFVHNIYLVSLYYLLFRLIFNLLTNRAILMNWFRQSLYWIAILSISYYSYDKIISNRINLLPDFKDFTNELWIIIAIFLFHTLNNIRTSDKYTVKRKDSYLKNRFNLFKKKYHSIIEKEISNSKLQALVYAIIIYEDFNRPKVARIAENISFRLTKKKHSLGVMQVQTNEFINDEKSVELGVEKIKKNYQKSIKKFKKKAKKNQKKRKAESKKLYAETGIVIPERDYNYDLSDWEITRRILNDYNNDGEYAYEVSNLHNKIFKEFDFDKSSTLNGKKTVPNTVYN